MNTETDKKKVLVVEDDEPTLSALRTILESNGLTVLEAKDGVAGIVVALEGRPDLILLDILMPKMDGWGMLREVRARDDWGKCVPVIVLTNLSADEDEQIRNITALGPSFFMVKSDWKLQGIVDKVLEILNSEKVPCP